MHLKWAGAVVQPAAAHFREVLKRSSAVAQGEDNLEWRIPLSPFPEIRPLIAGFRKRCTVSNNR